MLEVWGSTIYRVNHRCQNTNPSHFHMSPFWDAPVVCLSQFLHTSLPSWKSSLGPDQTVAVKSPHGGARPHDQQRLWLGSDSCYHSLSEAWALGLAALTQFAL